MSLATKTFSSIAGTNAAGAHDIFVGLVLVFLLLIGAWIVSSAYKGIDKENLTKEEVFGILIRLAVLFCIACYFLIDKH